MKELDQHRTTSEQDYGPWLDAATLYEVDNRFLLRVQGGYSRPYDEAWYVLASRPVKPLSELLTVELWADPSRDQSEELADDLGVTVQKTTKPS